MHLAPPRRAAAMPAARSTDPDEQRRIDRQQMPVTDVEKDLQRKQPVDHEKKQQRGDQGQVGCNPPALRRPAAGEGDEGGGPADEDGEGGFPGKGQREETHPAENAIVTGEKRGARGGGQNYPRVAIQESLGQQVPFSRQVHHASLPADVGQHLGPLGGKVVRGGQGRSENPLLRKPPNNQITATRPGDMGQGQRRGEGQPAPAGAGIPRDRPRQQPGKNRDEQHGGMFRHAGETED